jgi:hypothetical protein
LSQREVAESAGISKHQQVQAVRVANIPAEKFEAEIEQPRPATVTQLAEMGKAVQSKDGPSATECVTPGPATSAGGETPA